MSPLELARDAIEQMDKLVEDANVDLVTALSLKSIACSMIAIAEVVCNPDIQINVPAGFEVDNIKYGKKDS